MPALKITPQQFGLVVSIYAFSAGTSGFLAAGFADRFDRKKILLFFYAGFILGTLLCGMAPNYHALLFGRLVTGLFGGVIGSITLAIATDLFSFEVRGRVMGLVQSAFSAAQVMGLPLGLFLSNHFGWHAAFLFIVVAALVVGVFIILFLRPINDHLKQKPDKNPVHHLLTTISNFRYVKAFGATALLATGGFMIMPFASAYTVHNLGIDIGKLPLIYLITGFFTMFTGPLIGRAADTFGKFKIFFFGSTLSVIMVIIYTNLGVTPLVGVIAINVILFVGIFSRIIPSQAILSAIPDKASRGSFMSVNSSIQQISGGVASFVAGLIVVEGPSGAIEHFDVVGYVVAGAAVITLIQMYFISRTMISASA